MVHASLHYDWVLRLWWWLGQGRPGSLAVQAKPPNSWVSPYKPELATILTWKLHARHAERVEGWPGGPAKRLTGFLAGQM